MDYSEILDCPDVIDTRDLIDAIDAAREEAEMEDEAGAFKALAKLEPFAAALEATPDYHYGESAIREDYFKDYIRELVIDCYCDGPVKFGRDGESLTQGWPWHHLSMDWEAAAEEAKVDYFEATLNGTVYLVRA